MANTAVSVLMTRCRDRINESSTTFYSDEFLIRAADEAQAYIVRESDSVEGTSTTTIDSSQTNPEQYSLPNDFLAIKRLTLDGYDLHQIYFGDIREAEIDETDESGDPESFWIWDGVIHLFPIPGDGNDGETLKIYYLLKATTGLLTATTSTLSLSNEYDDIVVAYMTYLCFFKNSDADSGDMNRADYVMNECNTKLALLKRKQKERKMIAPPRFRTSDNLNTRDAMNDYGFRRRY